MSAAASQPGLPFRDQTGATGGGLRFHSCWLSWLVLLMALPGATLALDPGRPLSQALLRVWQGQQGLPRGVIFSLRQTEDGYLWLGTQAGLYRFDGVRFVAWESPEFSVPEQLWVEELDEDAAGFLWVATDGAGALRIRRETVEHFSTVNGLPSDRVHCVLSDRQGTVWLGTESGLSQLPQGSSTPQTVGLAGHSIQALTETADGRIWMAVGENQLFCWNGTALEQVDFSLPSPRATLECLAASPDGTLWLGTSEGLIAHRRNGDRLLTTKDGLPDNLIHTLAATDTGLLWVGTKDGFCRIQGEQIERFQASDGLSQSTVRALCEDREGCLWVGTKNGLNQFIDRRALFPFTTAEGLPSNHTGPILQDRSGTIWVGTLGAGLARFDGRRFESVATRATGLPGDRILSLAVDHQRRLWIGTDAGLCRWNGSSVDGVWSAADGLPADTISCLAVDSQHQIWIGTTSGLVSFRDGRFVPPAGANGSRPVHALAAGPSGDLFVSMAESLYQVEGQQLSLLPPQLQFSAVARALHLDAEQRLWVALADRGLGLIDGHRKREFGIRDGLFDDDIYGITSNDKGQLWLGCSRGIFSVQKDEIFAFVGGNRQKLTSLPFSPTDALRTIECQSGVQPSVWKTDDGRVWFSTVRGIIVAAAERVGAPLPLPKVLIEDVRVDGQTVHRNELERLPPGRNNMQIRFTALSLAWPARIRFRYRLLGFDKDWIDGGYHREAFYTNLPPGNYAFQVQATTADGQSTSAAEPLDIVLRPFFYQTRWFLPSLGLGLAVIAWLGYRWRVRQIKSRWQAVLAERNRIARELHDTLIQGFSGVTMQLQALLARLRNSPEGSRLAGIIQDAAGCLSEARRSVAGLRQPRPAGSNLTQALAEMAHQLTESADVRLRLDLNPPGRSWPPDVEYQVVRIAQEAIANAVKHSGADQIVVSLLASNSGMTMTVADDGSGFDPETYLHHPPPGHYGMIGIRERAAQMGATVRWQSERHRGTTVTLTWPAMPAWPGSPEATGSQRLEMISSSVNRPSMPEQEG